MAAYRRVYDSRHLHLTAKNRDQLRNPTLSNRVWATFTFFYIHTYKHLITRTIVKRKAWIWGAGGRQVAAGQWILMMSKRMFLKWDLNELKLLRDRMYSGNLFQTDGAQ